MKLPLRGRLLLTAAVLPIVGCIVVGVSWREWSIHSRLEKNGIEAVGKVVGSEKKSRKRSSSYNLLVSYSASNRMIQGNFTAKPDIALKHPVGSKVALVYDQKDESVARLKASLNSGEFRLLMVLGLGMFALGPVLGLVAFKFIK